MATRKTLLCLLCSVAIFAPDFTQAIDKDNSGINKRDQHEGSLTAESQSTSEKAEDTTRRIRKMIMDDDALSTTARNIKIITNESGVVTLKGPVKSESERTSIERFAVEIAGAPNVRNQLEVTTKG